MKKDGVNMRNIKLSNKIFYIYLNTNVLRIYTYLCIPLSDFYIEP